MRNGVVVLVVEFVLIFFVFDFKESFCFCLQRVFF